MEINTDGVAAVNAALWQAERQAEQARREAFAKTIVLPFKAEYGVHRVRRGELYALVVHTDWRDMRSPYRVKYVTIGKKGGNWATFETDADGNRTRQKGRAIIGNRLVGWRKVG